MTILKISDLNRGWGICGFASALGALHQNGLLGNTIDKAVTQDHLKTRILAEIKSYLVLLQSQKHQSLIHDIEEFTSTFAGFGGFKIQSYINHINDIALNDPDRADKQFSIAMPASAVADYLRQMGELKHVQLIDQSSLNFNNVILGLGDKTDTKRMKWKGLAHWVYMNNNIIYNWGKKQTLQQLMQLQRDRNWQIVYQILIRK